MTFKEAMNKLRDIAAEHGSNYLHCQYTATESNCKIIKVDCQIYYHNGPMLSGSTWEEAFDKLDKYLNPSTKVLTLDEAPEEESL